MNFKKTLVTENRDVINDAFISVEVFRVQRDGRIDIKTVSYLSEQDMIAGNNPLELKWHGTTMAFSSEVDFYDAIQSFLLSTPELVGAEVLP